jgi:hypothetical protein
VFISNPSNIPAATKTLPAAMNANLLFFWHAKGLASEQNGMK